MTHKYDPTAAPHLSRRDTLARLGGGFGGLALAALLGNSARAGEAPPAAGHNLLPRPPQHQPKALAVIQLFMHGGPSHVDLLDPKPELSRLDGQPPPAEVADDENRTTHLLGSPFKFSKHGQSGLEFSEVLPGIAGHADDIAVIRSMFTEHRNHEQAIWMANTGLIVSGRPNIGSWVAYGLGTENQNLPAYVALPDPAGLPVDGARNWSSGWLPPLYQGTAIRSEGMPVLHLQPKTARPADIDHARMDLLAAAQRPPSAGSPRRTGTWTPASPASSSPRGCSSPPPTRSISLRKPPRRNASTAWTRTRPDRTANAA